MEYAPEAIAQLAHQVTQVFKAALEQRLASSPTVVTIADVEKEMRELLRQMGAQALSQFLSLGAGTPVAEVPGGSGAELSFCAGINGLLGTAVQWTIFSQNVLVANMQDADQLKTSNFMLGIVDISLGFQVGNTLRPTLRVDDKVELIDQPISALSALYFWQITRGSLALTTHRYDLTTGQPDRDVSLGEMILDWKDMNSKRELVAPTLSTMLEPYLSDPLYMSPATAQLAGASAITFTQAGIKVNLPLYLREAYANPTQECWLVPVSIVPPILFRSATSARTTARIILT